MREAFFCLFSRISPIKSIFGVQTQILSQLTLNVGFFLFFLIEKADN